jgi:hypothetical protein
LLVGIAAAAAFKLHLVGTAKTSATAAGAVIGAAAEPSSTVAADTPAPTPSSTADSRNAQRKSDLAAFLSAYRAQAANGYYQTNPPAVTSGPSDPSTGQPYIVSKNKAVAVGDIQYWPGGVCTGAAHTPGATSTKYLALVIVLDDSHTTYCIDSTHN